MGASFVCFQQSSVTVYRDFTQKVLSRLWKLACWPNSRGCFYFSLRALVRRCWIRARYVATSITICLSPARFWFNCSSVLGALGLVWQRMSFQPFSEVCFRCLVHLSSISRGFPLPAGGNIESGWCWHFWHGPYFSGRSFPVQKQFLWSGHLSGLTCWFPGHYSTLKS